MIRLEEVSLAFGDVSVLSNVELTVERGEFVAIVGPNGAGKTTLLRTINGLLEPDDGAVCLDDDCVDDLSAREVSQIVATVPQDTHIGFSFTAENIVEMGRTPHRSRLDWGEDMGPVEAAMERTETLAFRDRAVEELSGGERQRVLLARALAQEPDALLLDEPTASLDINHQVRVLELVSDLVAEGKTALAAIHDLDLAARFCDRLVLLADGDIAASGPPKRVLSDPALAAAFETATAVTTNPVTGTPAVAAFGRRDSRDARIHLVGGGIGGRTALRALWREGFATTLGPVPEGDVAARLADELDVDAVTAPAFEAPGEDVRREATTLAGQADVVVTTGGPGSEQWLPAAGDASIASGDLPHIRATLGGSGPRATLGDGGEGEVVETEAELLERVTACLEE